MSKGIMDIIDNYYTSRVLLWIGKNEPRPIDNPEYASKLKRLKDQALSDISALIREAVDQCLVWNDSDTHIIVKDLREVLKEKGI